MIELLVLDVDGCLTDGKITYTTEGDELKSFNVKDGLAITSWIKMGKDVAIITGRNSKVVTRRANELGIKHLFQGIADKQGTLDKLRLKLHLQWENIAVIGDDLNDYKMLQYAGISFAPHDASEHIQATVHHCLRCCGGEGAVREMIEYLINRNGEQETFLALWQ